MTGAIAHSNAHKPLHGTFGTTSHAIDLMKTEELSLSVAPNFGVFKGSVMVVPDPFERDCRRQPMLPRA